MNKLNQEQKSESSNEKLSDASISKIITLVKETMSDNLRGVDWEERSKYGIYDALNDSLDDIERQLKDI